MENKNDVVCIKKIEMSSILFSFEQWKFWIVVVALPLKLSEK